MVQVSGQDCTLEMDVDYPGHDLFAVPMSTTEHSACLTRCIATTGCTHFSFINHVTTRGPWCYLKTGKGTPMSWPGAVSGSCHVASGSASDRIDFANKATTAVRGTCAASFGKGWKMTTLAADGRKVKTGSPKAIKTCAGSEINGRCTRTYSAKWKKASRKCAAVGARLCSVKELSAGVASGTGCGLDQKLVWTQNRCKLQAGGGGRMVTFGGSTHQLGAPKPFCASSSKEKYAIRCCADAPDGAVEDTAGVRAPPVAAAMHAGSSKDVRRSDTVQAPVAESTTGPLIAAGAIAVILAVAVAVAATMYFGAKEDDVMAAVLVADDAASPPHQDTLQLTEDWDLDLLDTQLESKPMHNGAERNTHSSVV